MESLRSVIAAMEPGEFLCSVDIQDAYLHVPICVQHQRFLRFAIEDNHYQFTALPFGLASAPRVFTKIMAAVMALLSRGILIIPYLDDLLIKGSSRSDCSESPGLSGHPDPSRLDYQPGQVLPNSVPMTVLPGHGVRHELGSGLSPKGQVLSSPQGGPSSQTPSSPVASVLHGSPGEDGGLHGGCTLHPVPHPPSPAIPPIHLEQVRQSLTWWTLSSSLLRGRTFLPLQWQVISTDASLLGWGAVFRHHTAQGHWTTQEALLPINLLEIRAIFLALLHWQSLLTGLPVRIQSENATGVAYLNHQGGTRSGQVMAETAKILRYAECHVLAISAVHIPRVENWAADFLRCQGLAAGEWSLHPAVFDQICLRWGTPDVDLMASRMNHKVPQFVARSRDPLAVGHDALGGKEDQVRRESGHTDSAELAKTSVVRRARKHAHGYSLETPGPARPPLAVASLPPEFSVAEFNGEAAVLKDSGLSPPGHTDHDQSQKAGIFSIRSFLDQSVPEFLPMVVSAFHINEDIVLPSFCPSPAHPLEKSLHKLDVVRAYRVYLSRTAPFRQSDSLLVVSEGCRKGLQASKSTISRWIRSAISESYCVHEACPPPGVRAHSTRAVGASWAVRHQASALQVCKATTWSSLHTFMSVSLLAAAAAYTHGCSVSPNEGSKKEILRKFLTAKRASFACRKQLRFQLILQTPVTCDPCLLHVVGMDFSEAYTDRCSTVGHAARSADIKSLRKLIKKGRSVDVPDNRGWMPIHEAAFADAAPCLQLLINSAPSRAYVKSKTFEGESALHLAAKRGSVGCSQILLQAGADPNDLTNDVTTPLFLGEI
ncbi:unnamed protein product [Ranitomeya imitator]|uniref:ribonuclease H n=1 Tax=Ranitomeya imitator TaxID=111125 RepID=A0ABN9LVT1_9NEOB|nr:unnamed protein product [Ranitomeya imitator]